MRYCLFIIFLFLFSCNSGGGTDYQKLKVDSVSALENDDSLNLKEDLVSDEENDDSQKLKVESVSAKKNDDRFTICLTEPIPEDYKIGGWRMVSFELVCIYKNGDIYETEGVLAADDKNQTCFNIDKIVGKWQYSDKLRIKRDKIFEEFSNENFKKVKISLTHRDYSDPLSVKTFHF